MSKSLTGSGESYTRASQRSLSPAQRLRKLQLAVDHIAAVIEADREGAENLSAALDLIHHAEIEIEGK